MLLDAVGGGVSVRGRGRGGPTARPGDADHHRLAGRPLLLGEHRVPVVGFALEHVRLAGPAGALGAGEQHLHPGGLARPPGRTGPAGTVSVRPDRASTTSNGAVTAGVGLLGGGTARRAGRPAGHAARTAPRPRRAAAPARSSRPGCPSPGSAEHGVEVQQARLVLRRDSVTVSPCAASSSRKAMDARRAAAVQQPPSGARRLGGGDHRQDRRDADAAGDEQVARRRARAGMVARAAHRAPASPSSELLVDVRRAAAARPAHAARRSARPAVGRVAAQRVLPDEAVGQARRSMCAPGSQAGSVRAVRTAQGQARPRRRRPSVRVDERVRPRRTCCAMAPWSDDAVPVRMRADRCRVAGGGGTRRVARRPRVVGMGEQPLPHLDRVLGAVLGAAVADARQRVGARAASARGRPVAGRRGRAGHRAAASAGASSPPAGPGCGGPPGRRCRC